MAKILQDYPYDQRIGKVFRGKLDESKTRQPQLYIISEISCDVAPYFEILSMDEKGTIKREGISPCAHYEDFEADPKRFETEINLLERALKEGFEHKEEKTLYNSFGVPITGPKAERIRNLFPEAFIP